MAIKVKPVQSDDQTNVETILMTKLNDEDEKPSLKGKN